MIETKIEVNFRGGSRIFFLGGGALVSCSTSTPINHIVFYLQNTSCIKKPQIISGGVRNPCTLPPDPPLNLQSFEMFMNSMVEFIVESLC